MMPLLCLDSSNRPTSYYKTNINMKYAVKSITSQPRYARYEKIEYTPQFTPDEPMPDQQPFLIHKLPHMYHRILRLIL